MGVEIFREISYFISPNVHIYRNNKLPEIFATKDHGLVLRVFLGGDLGAVGVEGQVEAHLHHLLPPHHDTALFTLLVLENLRGAAISGLTTFCSY